MHWIGGRILHYDILRPLGTGAMGVVYQAYDSRLQRTVALKFLSPHLQNAGVERARLDREARAASVLDHPNIGVVHAIEEDHGCLFIVMAYYEGETLKQRIARGPLPVSEAARIAVHVATGLAEAHRAGIVHRDLKPSNIILTSRGLAKIVDFGLAKMAGEPDLTEPGTTVGTVAYMSPEQMIGQSADARADLWSLGVILYEMLTGKQPFTGENNQALMYAVVNHPAPETAGLDPGLARVIDRSLSKNRSERYQEAWQVLKDLTRVHRPDIEYVSTQSMPVRMRCRLGVRLVTAALAAVFALAWFIWNFTRQPSLPARHVAVLPFQTSAPGPAEQALATGLAEAITDSLTHLESGEKSLLVVPSADIRSQRISDVGSAHRAFAVKLALTGGLAQENGQLRLSLTLVDATKKKPLASATIEEPAENLPVVHRRAVVETARMLTLRSPPPRLLSAPPRAYSSWLRGVGFMERFDKEPNLDSAAAEFEAVLREAPAYAPALVGLSQVYLSRFETSRDPRWLEPAHAHGTKAIELDQSLADAYLARGAVRNARGDYKGAVEDFGRALILDARRDAAYRGLARAYEGMGLKDRAEEVYRKAISIRSSYWAGHHLLGAFYFRNGRYPEAASAFRRVADLTPDNARAYSNLGSALSRQGLLDDARRMFEESIRRAPTYGAYNNLAILLTKQRRYSESAAALEKALELNRENYVVWGNLGASYARIPGQRSKAEDAFRRALELGERARAANPKDAQVLANLAQYHAFLGRRSDPLTLIQAALALAPTDVAVLIDAAEVYETLGFREEALHWLGKSLELNYPLAHVKENPIFDELRKDSRFGLLTQRRK